VYSPVTGKSKKRGKNKKGSEEEKKAMAQSGWHSPTIEKKKKKEKRASLWFVRRARRKRSLRGGDWGYTKRAVRIREPKKYPSREKKGESLEKGLYRAMQTRREEKRTLPSQSSSLFNGKKGRRGTSSPDGREIVSLLLCYAKGKIAAREGERSFPFLEIKGSPHFASNLGGLGEGKHS